MIVDDDAAGAETVPPNTAGYVIRRNMTREVGEPTYLSHPRDRVFSPNDVVWGPLRRAWLFETYSEADTEHERVWNKTNRASIEPYATPPAPPEDLSAGHPFTDNGDWDYL